MKIDTTKPLELTDGTPVSLIGVCKNGDIVGEYKRGSQNTLHSWTNEGKPCQWTPELRNVHEPEPEPKRIPLGNADVPPGSAIKQPHWVGWKIITSIGPKGIATQYERINYECLMSDGWLIKRPGEEWKPCWKLEETK